ncbi:hypothetical protein ACJ73_05050 [Blastomyces percursus]|uniref:C2H2-type domain-containing protein n=1 Tax=Blastomyces percursus TaxID=1658174 RepID=A0A1J9Q4J4_9EURO|nr:hypothetical protein ACJ73_05050 [Blastomyces percursus]
MDKYYEVLEDDKPMECGSLHCDGLFNSVLELRYHYQDVHCIPVPRKRSNVKPGEKSGVAGSPQDGDNTSSGLEFHITTAGSFKRKRTESSDSEIIDLPVKRHNYGSACRGPSNKLFSPNQTSSDANISGSRDRIMEDSSSGSCDNGDDKKNGLDVTDTSRLASVGLSHIDPPQLLSEPESIVLQLLAFFPFLPQLSSFVYQTPLSQSNTFLFSYLFAGLNNLFDKILQHASISRPLEGSRQNAILIIHRENLVPLTLLGKVEAVIKIQTLDG